jgi:Ca2+-binding RTX toxin-like protein
MRLRGIGMTLEGAEGVKSPPHPFIEVEDGEAETLLALYPKGVAVVGDDDSEEPDDDTTTGSEGPETIDGAAGDDTLGSGDGSDTLAGGEGGDTLPGSEGGDTVVGATGGDTLAGGTGGDRVEHPTDLVDAFELLEADDFVKTGDRKGKPSVTAIKNIVERDVSAEDIDAAWDARQAAE